MTTPRSLITGCKNDAPPLFRESIADDRDSIRQTNQLYHCDISRADFLHRAVRDSENASPVEDLLALDEALIRLEEQWPEKAKLVKLRYFTGLTIPEASQAL